MEQVRKLTWGELKRQLELQGIKDTDIVLRVYATNEGIIHIELLASLEKSVGYTNLNDPFKPDRGKG